MIRVDNMFNGKALIVQGISKEDLEKIINQENLGGKEMNVYKDLVREIVGENEEGFKERVMEALDIDRIAERVTEAIQDDLGIGRLKEGVMGELNGDFLEDVENDIIDRIVDKASYYYDEVTGEQEDDLDVTSEDIDGIAESIF